MKGIGVDIVDLERLDIHNLRFVQHILSKKEYEIYESLHSSRRKLEFLAGRFAGKEAYLKANHVGIGAIDFKDIEILNHADGSPYLHDKAAHISISHEQKYAVAFVVIEK